MTTKQSLHKVAITGIGLVTPLGTTTATSWHRLLQGHSGLVHLPSHGHPDLHDLPCHIAGLVPPPTDPTPDILNNDTLRKSSRFIHHALRAAHLALNDAHWHPKTDAQRWATGVSIGSGIGSVDAFAACAALPLRKVSPYAVPKALVNMAAGWTSLALGLWGPNLCSATACAAGAHAIADAARVIALGDADVMLAGAAESTINRVSLAGFARAKALCVDANHIPEAGSRPFDSSRAGFVMGEGAGVLVLESLDHALARGAPRIYGILAGTGASGDAHHITSPHPDGRGAVRAMQLALRGLPPGMRLGYVNAHATSTELGDAIELRAIRQVVAATQTPERDVLVSSTKGALGHLLGAAGAVEAGISLLALYHGHVPGTRNLQSPDPAAGQLHLPNAAERAPGLEAVLTNSFGFGGTNASLLFVKHT